MGTTKTQISLGIRPVWSESSLCIQYVAKNPRFLHADSEDSDQTGRMPRLIWVFAGHTSQFVGFDMRWLIFIVLFLIPVWRDMALTVTILDSICGLKKHFQVDLYLILKQTDADILCIVKSFFSERLKL